MPRRVQLLRLEMPEVHVDTLINTANRVQSHVYFDHVGEVAFDKSEHRLPRRMFNLDPLIETSRLVTTNGTTFEGSEAKPLLVLTTVPYGERGAPPEEELTGLGMDNEVGSAVLSTGLWTAVTGSKRVGELEPYVLTMLATFILSWWADLDYHTATRGCLFDYCDTNADIIHFFDDENAFLCDRCYTDVEDAIRRGKAPLADVVAARRLVTAARNKRACFVAMPLAKDHTAEFKKMFQILNEEFTASGWQVRRSDLLRRPRDIIARIIVELLASDRVIAEVTYDNANVFYELGYADASSRDILLLSQRHDLPFDLSHRHAILWENNTVGLRALRGELRREASAV